MVRRKVLEHARVLLPLAFKLLAKCFDASFWRRVLERVLMLCFMCIFVLLVFVASFWCKFLAHVFDALL